MDLHKRALKAHGKSVMVLLDRNWKGSKEYFMKSNIPRLQIEDLSGLPDLDGLSMEQLSKSRFMCGVQGVGKTVESCRLMVQHFKERNYMGEWETMESDGHKVRKSQKPFTYKFTSLTDFYLDVQETFKPTSTVSTKEVLNSYKDFDFLIIDDIGKEKPSEWAFSMFFKLINDRHNAMKQTIVTSNWSLKQLESKGHIDAALKRRLNCFDVSKVSHYSKRK